MFSLSNAMKTRKSKIFRKTKHQVLSYVFVAVTFLSLLTWIALEVAYFGGFKNIGTHLLRGNGGHDDNVEWSRRRLKEEGSPDRVFSMSQLRSGLVALHMVGVAYTFIAIAIVKLSLHLYICVHYVFTVYLCLCCVQNM